MIEVDVVVVSNFRNFLVADEVMSTVDLTASSMDPGQGCGRRREGGKFGTVVGIEFPLLLFTKARSLQGEHGSLQAKSMQAKSSRTAHTSQRIVHHRAVAGGNSFNSNDVKVVLQYAATPAMHLEPNASKFLQNLYSPTSATPLLPSLLLQYTVRVIYSPGAHCPPIRLARADRGRLVSLSARL